MDALGKLTTLVALSVPIAIFNGYVLSILWGWFVVPTFRAPALGLVPAIGIALVTSYLTHQFNGTKEKKEDFGRTIRDFVYSATAKSTVTLFFGWVAHLFM